MKKKETGKSSANHSFRGLKPQQQPPQNGDKNVKKLLSNFKSTKI